MTWTGRQQPIDPSLIIDTPVAVALRIGGQSFTQPFTPDDGFRLTGHFSAPVRHNSFPTDPSSFIVSIGPFPFVFSGLLAGPAPDGTDLQVKLAGVGRGHATYLSDDFGVLRRFDASFTFEPTTPTPEPATIILLLCGICAIALRCGKPILP